MMSKGYSKKRIFIGTMISAIIGLQLGAFSVVLQTLLSGKTELPFQTFLALMQPIHLAIGIVEGLVTTAVAEFVWRTHPEIIEKAAVGDALGSISIKKVLVIFVAFAVIIGGGLSWFASSNPDGLEWSMFHASGKEELESSNPVHQTLAAIQEKISFLPDYGFKESVDEAAATDNGESEIINSGTSVSGLAGGAMTLLLACLIGMLINKMKRINKGKLIVSEENDV